MLNIVYNQPHALFNHVRSNVELTERFLDLVQDVYFLEQKERENRSLQRAQRQFSKALELLSEVDEEDEDEKFSVEILQDHEAKESRSTRLQTGSAQQINEQKLN